MLNEYNTFPICLRLCTAASMLPPSVTIMCPPASPATSAWASQLIMEIQSWLLCPQLPFCLEMESLNHGKFWGSADDRQLPTWPCQLGLRLLHILQLAVIQFFSPFLGFDRFPSSSCPFLSFLLSLHLFLPYTCMDNLLPASANPFQTPPYPFHHKCQNSPQGPKPNCGMCNSDSLKHCASMAFSHIQTETTEKNSHWWLTS